MGTLHKIYKSSGNFLVIQWVGLRASTTGGTGSIHGQGTKILLSLQHGQKKKKSSQELTTQRTNPFKCFSLANPPGKEKNKEKLFTILSLRGTTDSNQGDRYGKDSSFCSSLVLGSLSCRPRSQLHPCQCQPILVSRTIVDVEFSSTFQGLQLKLTYKTD